MYDQTNYMHEHAQTEHVAIGSQDYIRDYTRDHVSQWAHGLSQLSLIAATQPHDAYTVLTHGFSSKWKYFLRTNPHIGDLLSPLELEIRQHFLPTLIPHPPSDLERESFGLPVSLEAWEFVIPVASPLMIIISLLNYLVLWLI